VTRPATAAASASIPELSILDLSAQVSRIIEDELAAARSRISRRVQRLCIPQAELIRDIVEQAIEEFGRSPEESNPLSEPRHQIAGRTLAILEVVEQEVRKCSDATGVEMSRLCELLKSRYNVSISTDSLRQLIRRTGDYHKVMVRRNKVRLRADLLIEYLERRHKAEKEKEERDGLADSK
jgi:transposase